MKNTVLILGIVISTMLFGQEKCDWEAGVPEGCTTITVGKKASKDGGVYTSHTDDSHRTRSWMDIVIPTTVTEHARGWTLFLPRNTLREAKQRCINESLATILRCQPTSIPLSVRFRK